MIRKLMLVHSTTLAFAATPRVCADGWKLPLGALKAEQRYLKKYYAGTGRVGSRAAHSHSFSLDHARHAYHLRTDKVPAVSHQVVGQPLEGAVAQ